MQILLAGKIKYKNVNKPCPVVKLNIDHFAYTLDNSYAWLQNKINLFLDVIFEFHLQ